MNDKIKALAQKADIWHDTHISVDFTKEDTQLDQFAKLIIQECGRVQHQRFCEHGDVSWDMLMYHFGIKE